MNKINKLNLIILLLVFTLLIFQLNFVSSEDDEFDESDEYEEAEFLEEIDISEIYGLKDVEIIGKGIDFFAISHLVEDENGREGYIHYCKVYFIEKYGYLKIDSNLFWNIVPQEEARHLTFIEFYEDGEIIKVDFTVDDNEDTSFYNINNEIIEIPSGTRILFNEKDGVNIKFPEGMDLTQFPNLMDIFSWNLNANKTIIKGKDIILSNGIHLIDGELEIKKEGYLLTEGTINYNNLMLSTYAFDGENMVRDIEFKEFVQDYSPVLIAKSDFNSYNYEGSWIRQSSDLLEMQSDESGVIFLEVLKDNNILDINEENKLLFSVMDGDSIKIRKKDDEKSIPEIIHKSSKEGWSKIGNGPLFISYDKDKYVFDFLTNENINDFIEMKIESDSTKIKEKIIVDPEHKIYSDDISILDSNENVILTYNDDLTE